MCKMRTKLISFHIHTTYFLLAGRPDEQKIRRRTPRTFSDRLDLRIMLIITAIYCVCRGDIRTCFEMFELLESTLYL